MTILLVISSLSLVLVNDNLLISAFAYNASCNCSTGNCWLTNLSLAVVYKKNLIKCNSVTSINCKLLNSDSIAFRNCVLLTTCCYNCLHMVSSLIKYSPVLGNPTYIRYTYTLTERHTKYIIYIQLLFVKCFLEIFQKFSDNP